MERDGVEVRGKRVRERRGREEERKRVRRG